MKRLDDIAPTPFGNKNPPITQSNERVERGFKPLERLDKILSLRAPMSRKDAKTLIKAGGVLVNGVPALCGEQKVTASDKIIVNGRPLCSDRHVYYMMNKPAGVLCSTRDKKCETVLDLLPADMQRKGLFPAGRLDKDTVGFVLITDDGDFAHRILSPKHHIPKTYFAVVDGSIPSELPLAFESGLDLGGGTICLPAGIKILKDSEASAAELVICEGMYHQIKRMFAAFSLNVTYLKRTAMGGLKLDADLPEGCARVILHKELPLILPDFDVAAEY